MKGGESGNIPIHSDYLHITKVQQGDIVVNGLIYSI